MELCRGIRVVGSGEIPSVGMFFLRMMTMDGGEFVELELNSKSLVTEKLLGLRP